MGSGVRLIIYEIRIELREPIGNHHDIPNLNSNGPKILDMCEKP